MIAKTSANRRGRPVDASGASTRDNILNAARESFALLGYGKATNKKIAQAAGVSASALYNYFPAKKDIYLAIVEEGELYIADCYEAAIKDITSPAAAISTLLAVNIDIYKNRPDLPPFFGHIQSEAGRFTELQETLQNKNNRIKPILLALVTEGQKRGEISLCLTAESISMMLFSAILGLSVLGLQTDAEQHISNMQAFKMLFDQQLLLKQ